MLLRCSSITTVPLPSDADPELASCSGKTRIHVTEGNHSVLVCDIFLS